MKINSTTIEKACTALETAKIVNSGGEYQDVFKGYISSFGASIAQAGLLPTVIFYENKSDSAQDRTKLIDALIEMLPQNMKPADKMLAKYIILNNKADDRIYVKTVTDAMVALKLALRMYSEKRR